jgi:hypothetical protein
VNILLFAAINARIVSAQALNSAVPDPQDRGAYMAVNGSLQQLSGGIAATAAGFIVIQAPDGHLERYDVLGWVVAAAMAATIAFMYQVQKAVAARQAAGTGPEGRAGRP